MLLKPLASLPKPCAMANVDEAVAPAPRAIACSPLATEPPPRHGVDVGGRGPVAQRDRVLRRCARAVSAGQRSTAPGARFGAKRRRQRAAGDTSSADGDRLAAARLCFDAERNRIHPAGAGKGADGDRLLLGSGRTLSDRHAAERIRRSERTDRRAEVSRRRTRTADGERRNACGRRVHTLRDAVVAARLGIGAERHRRTARRLRQRAGRHRSRTRCGSEIAQCGRRLAGTGRVGTERHAIVCHGRCARAKRGGPEPFRACAAPDRRSTSVSGDRAGAQRKPVRTAGIRLRTQGRSADRGGARVHADRGRTPGTRRAGHHIVADRHGGTLAVGTGRRGRIGTDRDAAIVVHDRRGGRSRRA